MEPLGEQVLSEDIRSLQDRVVSREEEGQGRLFIYSSHTMKQGRG
jgi:hypothetical protein